MIMVSFTQKSKVCHSGTYESSYAPYTSLFNYEYIRHSMLLKLENDGEI